MDPFKPVSNRNLSRWRQLSIPAYPYFELTPRCTLDCKMCYVHLTPAQMGAKKELTTEQWLQISDEAIEAGMLFVVLTGGECMLHPGFWEIYEHLREKGVGVTINTNAYTITDEDIERLRRHPPTCVRVTLYGASEEGYERCTGHRAFSRVLENIIKLRDAGFLVGVAMTLSRYTMDEYIETARLVRSLQVRYGHVLDLSEPNEGTGRHAEDFVLRWEETKAIVQQIYEDEHRIIHSNEPISELPAILPDDPTLKGLRCGAGRTSYVIRWDGTMTPCLEFFNGKKVQDVGFREAWENCKAMSRDCLLPVECETCKLFPVCTPCAMLRQDRDHPGHCNPARCRNTINSYNAGFMTLKNGMSEPSILNQANDNC